MNATNEIFRDPDIAFSIQPALAHLRDARAPLSPALLSTLSALKKNDLADVAATWRRLPAERRRRAAETLRELGKENARFDFTTLFRYLLDDADAAVRAAGIAGLWEESDPALARSFIRFLQSDPEAQVRAAAADALGRFVLLGEYDRLPANLANLIHESLLATWRNPAESVDVRAHALASLGYSSRDGMHNLIGAAYDGDDDELRLSALTAMGHSADSNWCDTIAAELDSPEARMRAESARALGELECRAYTARIIALLDDPDRDTQIAAIRALSRIGGKPAHAALIHLCESDDSTLSEIAQDALEEMSADDSDDLSLKYPVGDDEDADKDLDENENG